MHIDPNHCNISRLNRQACLWTSPIYSDLLEWIIYIYFKPLLLCNLNFITKQQGIAISPKLTRKAAEKSGNWLQQNNQQQSQEKSKSWRDCKPIGSYVEHSVKWKVNVTPCLIGRSADSQNNINQAVSFLSASWYTSGFCCWHVSLPFDLVTVLGVIAWVLRWVARFYHNVCFCGC